MLKQIGNIGDPDSLASRMRGRRFSFFRELVDTLPRPLSILDVGGSWSFWQRAKFDNEAEVSLTLLNLGAPPDLPRHVTYVQGDARRMTHFADSQFDIVFSNSTIEHVGDFSDQTRMA